MAAPKSAPAQKPGPAPGRTNAPDPSDLSSAARETGLRHYLQGIYLEQQGDLAGAVQEVGKAFAYEPTAPDLALKMADLSLQGGEGERGLDYARRSIALGEKTGKAHFLAGAALVGLGRVPEAEPELAIAAQQDSANAETWEALGRVRDELGRTEDARIAYARAYWISPDDADITFRLATIETRLAHYGAADSLLDRVEELNPYLPGLFVTRAFVAERLGHAGDAAKDYRAHLEMFPNDDKARRRLVTALLRMDDKAAATQEAKRLYEQSPEDFELGRVLASLYLTQNQNEAAVQVVKAMRKRMPGAIEPAAFATAVLLHVGKQGEARSESDALTREAPENYRAWIVAAETWANGETVERPSQDANRRYEQVVRVLPDSTSALVDLSRSYTRTKRYGEAEAALDSALAREPNNARLWLELAFAHERRKDVPGAEVAAQKSLDLDNTSGAALNFLGYLYADYNLKVDQAVPLIQKALVLEPGNPYYIDSLGWAYYRLGRFEDARSQLEQALELGGDEPEVLEHLGDVYLALARKADAKSQYRKALQLDPTSVSLARKLEALR
jgi:Flp pilus assembly protein TadD